MGAGGWWRVVVLLDTHMTGVLEDGSLAARWVVTSAGGPRHPRHSEQVLLRIQSAAHTGTHGLLPNADKNDLSP
jgi:hypothetical protein